MAKDDPVKDESEWSPETTAHHEAAHAVGNFIFGFGNSYLTIRGNPDEGSAGTVSALEYQPEQFEGHMVTWIAGYAATCRFESKADAYAGARHDFDMAKKECEQFGIEFIEAEWIAKAEAFVETEWHAITALAKEAVIHQELDDVEVDLIIEAARATDPIDADQFAKGLERYRQFIKPNNKRPPA